MNFTDIFRVYFVKPVSFDGPIKIGISNNPELRISRMQDLSPFRLEIIGSVPGTWRDEQFLHKELAEYRSHGEWFEPSRKVIDKVKSVLSTGSFNI
jgi:hypothetical protein